MPPTIPIVPRFVDWSIYWNFLAARRTGRTCLSSILACRIRSCASLAPLASKARNSSKPEDDYEALKDFTHAYEGTTSPLEEMNLEYQKLLQEHPGLAERLDALPGRLFSGKEHPKAWNAGAFSSATQCLRRHLSFTTERCRTTSLGAAMVEPPNGIFSISTPKRFVDEPAKIIGLIRSTPETPRKHDVSENTLSEIRVKVEKHIKNTYLKQVQAPIGVKPALKAWMELS